MACSDAVLESVKEVVKSKGNLTLQRYLITIEHRA
jgi:hypothetical protein